MDGIEQLQRVHVYLEMVVFETQTHSETRTRTSPCCFHTPPVAYPFGGRVGEGGWA